MMHAFLIISSLCMNITEYKNKRDSVCFQCCHIVLPLYQFFLQLFQTFAQSPQSPTFVRKFLEVFFCSINFKDVQMFHQNWTFTITIPRNPPSNSVNRHTLTTWFTICCHLQSQTDDLARLHRCRFVRNGSWSVQKQFSKDQRGVTRIVGQL